MAVKHLFTRGYGNGIFNGTIALVMTRGYSVGTLLPLSIGKSDVDITIVKKDIDATIRIKGVDVL